MIDLAFQDRDLAAAAQPFPAIAGDVDPGGKNGIKQGLVRSHAQ